MARLYTEMSARLKDDHWTQSTVARDAEGNPVNATSENAVRWCLLGVNQRIAAIDLPYLYADLPWELAMRPFKKHNNITVPLSDWNDSPDRSEADVVFALYLSAALLNTGPDHLIDLDVI